MPELISNLKIDIEDSLRKLYIQHYSVEIKEK